MDVIFHVWVDVTLSILGLCIVVLMDFFVGFHCGFHYICKAELSWSMWEFGVGLWIRQRRWNTCHDWQGNSCMWCVQWCPWPLMPCTWWRICWKRYVLVQALEECNAKVFGTKCLCFQIACKLDSIASNL